jgi:hypothetical protein
MKINMKNIEWKKSEIDYDALNKLTHAYLQFQEFAELGRKKYSKDPRLKHNAKSMGDVQGKKNVESGHLAKVRNPKKSGKVSGDVIRFCNRCGKTLKGNAAMNMHNNYHNSFDEIYNFIDKEFSIKELKQILSIKLQLTDLGAFKKARSFAKDPYYSIKIYNGTPGSNNDVAIYKKIETLS